RGEMVAGESRGQRCCVRSWEEGVILLPFLSLGSGFLPAQHHHLLLVAFISLSSPCTDRGWTCCPKGWRRFQKSCYFLSLDKMNWAESQQNCTGMGSQLVVINSREEQVGRDTGLGPGGDSEPLLVLFWRKGQPSGFSDENCTVMYVLELSINNWNDVTSDLRHHRICEAAAVTV
uniref:C-type lectin domain-containing protein n=1 Tax=Cyanoderma ruficeps TaxID=181631 RepID=A0A8C3XBP9_9PASS